jgi:hypothetical protein
MENKRGRKGFSIPGISTPINANVVKILIALLTVAGGMAVLQSHNTGTSTVTQAPTFSENVKSNVGNVNIALQTIKDNKGTIRYSVSCDEAKETINGYILDAQRDHEPEHKVLNTKYTSFLFESLRISNLYKNNKNAAPNFTKYNKLYAELHGN